MLRNFDADLTSLCRHTDGQLAEIHHSFVSLSGSIPFACKLHICNPNSSKSESYLRQWSNHPSLLAFCGRFALHCNVLWHIVGVNLLGCCDVAGQGANERINAWLCDRSGSRLPSHTHTHLSAQKGWKTQFDAAPYRISNIPSHKRSQMQTVAK